MCAIQRGVHATTQQVKFLPEKRCARISFSASFSRRCDSEPAEAELDPGLWGSAGTCVNTSTHTRRCIPAEAVFGVLDDILDDIHSLAQTKLIGTEPLGLALIRGIEIWLLHESVENTELSLFLPEQFPAVNVLLLTCQRLSCSKTESNIFTNRRKMGIHLSDKAYCVSCLGRAKQDVGDCRQ